jgi:hypothetical protein
MHLTQRRLVYLALATIVGVGVLTLYIGYVSWSPINRDAVALIRPGMAEAQVERILGGPCSASIEIPQPAGDKTGPGDPLMTYKLWHDENARCVVIFDAKHRVRSATYREAPGRGMIARIRAALGFSP